MLFVNEEGGLTAAGYVLSIALLAACLLGAGFVLARRQGGEEKRGFSAKCLAYCAMAIALAYAELVMTCNDLGFIYVSTPWAALQTCPRARAFLQIPENHYISCLVGFGKPEYQFVRGVWRSDALKINRITGETTREQL